MKTRWKEFVHHHKKHLVVFSSMLLLIGLNIGATAFLRGHPQIAEQTFVPIAKWVSSGMRWLINHLPFSLTETIGAILVLLLCICLLGLLMIGVSSLYHVLVRKFGWRDRFPQKEGEEIEEPGSFFRTITTLSVVAALLFSYFNIAYGFVFARPTMFELLNLTQRGHSAEELYKVCSYLGEEAAKARAELPEGYDPSALEFDFQDLRIRSTDAFVKLQEKEPVFSGMIAKPKAVYFSKVMSYLGISGMYAPFFSESSISVDGISASIPFTIAHELAHGVMVGREDEANFAAFLATTADDDSIVRYSGYYRAFLYCSNALYSVDESLYKKLIENTDMGLRSDRKNEIMHVRQYDGLSVQIAEKFNDTFIKATGQKHGVDSYGRVVDLILAYYDKIGLDLQ